MLNYKCSFMHGHPFLRDVFLSFKGTDEPTKLVRRKSTGLADLDKAKPSRNLKKGTTLVEHFFLEKRPPVGWLWLDGPLF